MLGITTLFLRETAYGDLATEDAERTKAIRRCVPPFDCCGSIEVIFKPIDGVYLNNPQELIGKPWAYKLEIVAISRMDLISCHTYCEFEFNGTQYATHAVHQKTRDPIFEFSCTLSTEKVEPAFLDYLLNGHITIAVFACAAGNLSGSKLW